MEREARSAGAAAVVSGGFSARQLFQRMASSVRPVPAMFRAVEIIKQAGETLQTSTFLLCFKN